MRFKSFLNENNAYTVKELDDEKFIAWCETNASDYLNTPGNIMFRGMGHQSKGVIDTNNFNRTSANTYNYYTLFFDNHPSWAAYPSRSKAYICSNSTEISEGFGSIHFIIPANNAKIGICPSEDLWYSFKKLESAFIRDMSLDSLMGEIQYLLRAMGRMNKDNELHEKAQFDYALLKDSLTKITPELAETLLEFNGSESIRRALEKNNYKNVFELMVDLLDPEDNKIQHTTPKGYRTMQLPGAHEVWVQGKCAVIYETTLMLNRSPIMREFYKKYFYKDMQK